MPCEKEQALPQVFSQWFAAKGWRPHAHQLRMLAAARTDRSALLIAPTGGGKTLAGFLPSLVELAEAPVKGLHTLYISPLKALAADIQRNLQAPIDEMNLSIQVEIRTGDTSPSRRQRQIKKPPQILLTTPESLELLLSYTDADRIMAGLKRVIIDEAHALAPGKRGHLTALCLAHLRRLHPKLSIFGLSATVADPERLADWLNDEVEIIHAAPGLRPKIRLMDTKARVPWTGYVGSYAVPEIYDAILGAKTSIVFTNTRAQAELLFRQLWEHNSERLPIALHHGSLERDHRFKVEASMNAGKLRAIIATASLDLGLDWGAVDLVIQVGAPKGVSRLLQRIGRSNHRLDEPSEAYLVPCNRFEMIECVAVLEAVEEGVIDGDPLLAGTLDVLAQFVMNSACGKGFDALALHEEIRTAAPYRHIDWETFEAIVAFVATGGYALRVYESFQRIARNEEGVWVASQVAVRRHRMNIGTIVEYEMLPVALRRKKSPHGVVLGRIEEYFIQGLKPGDTFLFAGQMLRYRAIRENRVEVERGEGERPKIPAFKGGRLPLFHSVAERVLKLVQNEREWELLPPRIQRWLAMQRLHSALPDGESLLAESFIHEHNHYLVLYGFAGRNANQTLGLLLSYHMERAGLLPLGFVANDYALALWGLTPIDDPGALLREALAQGNSEAWIESSQMAKRAFRDVALISGLVERGYPGGRKTGRQVTISTDLIYDVLRKYEPDHILLRATKEDVTNRLADIDRLRAWFAHLPMRHVLLDRVSPFAIPLLLEIGSEAIKGGEAETALLKGELREQAGDELLRKATGE